MKKRRKHGERTSLTEKQTNMKQQRRTHWIQVYVQTTIDGTPYQQPLEKQVI